MGIFPTDPASFSTIARRWSRVNRIEVALHFFSLDTPLTWLPHQTVATIVEKDGRLLLVEELADGQSVLNQPAGHLEPDESLLQAALRETLEETGWEVALQALLGIYQYTSPANGITYVRTCFIASPVRRIVTASLDPEIIAVHWLTPVEIQLQQQRLRSPAVWQVIQDYLAGQRYPLNLIRTIESTVND
jgi:8-oxo-dGTP pyrophosphatase MutT (NUDIX family)